MEPSQEFTTVLREWSETFMHRSMRDFNEFMRSSGLSMPQVSTMFRLYYRGSCGISDIAGHLDVTSAAASQMVDRLVQQGLLERSEDPDDRRVKQVRLTPAGRRILLESIEARQRWWTELTRSLSSREQVAIKDSLRLLTEKARQLEPVLA